MKRKWLVVFLCFCLSKAVGQGEVGNVPIQFGQFYSNYSLINPASIGVGSRTHLNSGVQFNTGPWNNIYTYYAHGYFQLSPDRKRRKLTNHVLGGNLFNDREGEFLNRLRIQLQYAVHVNLSERVSLGAGATLGLMNYTVGATPLNAGGAALAPDAALGLWLYGKDFQAGASFNQLFNSELTPLEETTKLIPFININAERSFEVGYNFTLIPNFILRWVPSNSNLTVFDVGVYSLLSDRVYLGLAFRQKRGYSVSFGLGKIEMNEGLLKIMFSYNTPKMSGFTNVNTFEVTLSFDIGYYQGER